MSINIYWEVPQHILGIAISGHISEIDIDQMGKAGVEAVQGGGVYVIVDFSAATSVPRNLMNAALRSSALLAFARHPNARFFAFVSPNNATRFVIDTVFRSVPYKVMDNYELALDMLGAEIIPNDEAQ